MSKQIALLLGVHAHQPVGNFNEVIDDAHLRCYQPFLRMMNRFPRFHFSIHISGWLLANLQRKFPDDMNLLRTMVLRGQAELFTAGYTEPVLASIPVRDRIGQVNLMSERLEQAFTQRPQGAWLTERVWDSTVVPSLVACGVNYVTVDDYHFLCAGQDAAALKGYFSTEEDGRRLDIYPISEALRYRIPFSPAREVVGYLEALASEDMPGAIYFDDIEKFGIWPETYDWVYQQGWLEQFVQGVLDSPVIRPMRYGDYHQHARTRGVVYLPTTSYIEMNEWTLPAQPARVFSDLVNRSKQDGRYDIQKAFIRGGIWRNFLSRYPESNWMHKRMVSLSNRFNQLVETRKTAEMRDHLYEAQANDAYWHGLFGGLYLPHLRRAIYHALVRLEFLLDMVNPRASCSAMDLDLDGYEEYFLHDESVQIVVRSQGLADVLELDSYRLNHNFADTLRRQEEHYHGKAQASLASENKPAADGIANPHEQVSFKHDIQPHDLLTDELPRSLFIDRFVVPEQGHAAATLIRYLPADVESDNTSLVFNALPQLQEAGIDLTKTYRIAPQTLIVSYDFHAPPQADLAVEINLAMPSCDGPAGCLEVAGEVLGGFGQIHERREVLELLLRDEVLGGRLVLSTSQPAHFQAAPLMSVSQSEAGFEKIMQAMTLHLSWSASALIHPLEIRMTFYPL